MNTSHHNQYFIYCRICGSINKSKPYYLQKTFCTKLLGNQKKIRTEFQEFLYRFLSAVFLLKVGGVSNRLAWKFKSRQIISEMSAHIRFCPLNLLPLFQNGLPHLLPLFSIQIVPICAILHLNNQIRITYETHINTVFFDAFTPTHKAYSDKHNNSPS